LSLTFLSAGGALIGVMRLQVFASGERTSAVQSTTPAVGQKRTFANLDLRPPRPENGGLASFATWYAKSSGHMFVGDPGEVSCGSKAGAIAVLCGMLRRVSQS